MNLHPATAVGENNRRRTDRLPYLQILLLSALCLLLFGHAIFASGEEIIAGYDILVYHYYARAFTSESILNGALPTWNPYEYAGMPFAADPRNCVFYPLNKIFLFVPISTALTLNLALHVLLAGAGTLLLARALGLGNSAAFLSAVSFMFSGYFIDRIAVGHEILIMGSAYLPWIFLCYEKITQKRRPGWVVAGGLFVALQILTGALQPALYTSLFLLVYAIARNIQLTRGFRLKTLACDLCLVVTMFALGLGLSAVQTIPAIEFFRHSVRVQPTDSFPFPPKNIIHFLLPYLNVGSASGNWESSCYIGILPLALAVAAVRAARKDVSARSFALVGLLAALVMLGGYTPFFPVILHVVPGLRLFRVHARAIVGLILALSILAGIGWERIFENPDKHRERWLPAIIAGTFAGAISLVAVLFAFGKLSLSFDIPSPSNNFGFLINEGGPVLSLWHPRIFLPLAAAWITCIAATLTAQKADLGMKGLLVGFVVADIFVMSLGKVRLVDLSYVTGGNTLVESIREDETSERFRVWFPIDVFFGSRSKYFGMFNVNGYNMSGLKVFEDYLAELSGARPVRTSPYYEMNSRIFREADLFVNNVLNVKYFSTQTDEGPVFYRADSFFPRAVFASDYVMGEPADFLVAGINPELTVLLHEPPPPDFPTRSPTTITDRAQARVVIDDYKNNEITVSVKAPVDGFIVLSEVYYPGWKAEVDGETVDVLRGDFLLRVVPVPKGKHEIRFYFAPRSLSVGIAVSAMTAILTIGLLVLFSMRSGRFPAVKPPSNQGDTDGAETQ